MARMVFNMALVQALPPSLREGEAKARAGAMDAGLKLWKREFLPRHFGQAANERYGYAKRVFEYLRTKKQMKHLRFSQGRGTLWPDRRPLENSGAMKTQLLGQRGTAKADKKSGALMARVLVLQAPRYLYQYRDRRAGLGKTPNKAAELGRIRDDEMAAMIGETMTDYERRMARLFRNQGQGMSLADARERAGRMVQAA